MNALQQHHLPTEVQTGRGRGGPVVKATVVLYLAACMASCSRIKFARDAPESVHGLSLFCLAEEPSPDGRKVCGLREQKAALSAGHLGRVWEAGALQDIRVLT